MRCPLCKQRVTEEDDEGQLMTQLERVQQQLDDITRQQEEYHAWVTAQIEDLRKADDDQRNDHH